MVRKSSKTRTSFRKSLHVCYQCLLLSHSGHSEHFWKLNLTLTDLSRWWGEKISINASFNYILIIPFISHFHPFQAWLWSNWVKVECKICIFMSLEAFWWLFWPFWAFSKVGLDWPFKVMRWENLYQCQFSFYTL